MVYCATCGVPTGDWQEDTEGRYVCSGPHRERDE